LIRAGDPVIFLYIVPLLLGSLATAFRAWQLRRDQTSNSRSYRIILFNCGLAISILSLLVTITCIVDPFPMAHSPSGGESTPLLDLAYEVAYRGAFLGIILALFGKGRSRILLVLSGTMVLLSALMWAFRNGI
jgi:hypothetical protein